MDSYLIVFVFTSYVPVSILEIIFLTVAMFFGQLLFLHSSSIAWYEPDSIVWLQGERVIQTEHFLPCV